MDISEFNSTDTIPREVGATYILYHNNERVCSVKLSLHANAEIRPKRVVGQIWNVRFIEMNGDIPKSGYVFVEKSNETSYSILMDILDGKLSIENTEDFIVIDRWK